MRELLRLGVLCIALVLNTACSDPGGERPGPRVIPTDFSAANASLESFVAGHPGFSGASLIIVDKEAGVIHRHYVDAHDEDTVYLLASTSKVPSVSLLMALADDDGIDFEMDRVIDDYLPWPGVWPGRTVEQLVSNTSGLPGLGQVASYGLHLCQYFPAGQLRECGQTIWQTPLDNLVSHPPGTNFEYGGSPWQLAGLVAEVVGGATWNQLFDQYIAQPCELDVFTYGNMLATYEQWTGDPDSLQGRDNPNIEGGGMTNIEDYSKILSMHLNEGRCGSTQVLSPQAVLSMRTDRAAPDGSSGPVGPGYGMGWWITYPESGSGEPTLFTDAGAFGAVAWIDTEREYGALMAVQSATIAEGSAGSGFGLFELIPLVAAAFDAARE